MLRFFRLYARVLGLLASEKKLAVTLASADCVLGLVALAEPLLFGRVVDALATGAAALPLILLWAALGIGDVSARAFISLFADRLAHRQRLAAMVKYFEHVVGLPLAFHSETHSGRLLRTMLAASDNLFSLWLWFLRDHLATVVSLLVMVPVAAAMDWRMTLLLLGLAATFAILSTFVLRQTDERQTAVDDQQAELAARVSDAIGNVQILQSFTRIAAEVAELRGAAADLLAAQTPVLTWWAILAVIERAAATTTVVCIFALGIYLNSLGQMTVGEIVSFVGFGHLLIDRLEYLSSFISQFFFQTKPLEEFFAVLDEPPGPIEKPDAVPLPPVTGRVEFQRVSAGFPGTEREVVRNVSFAAEPGQTVALVGHTGSGKTSALALLYRLRDPDQGRILVDGHDLRDVTLLSLRGQIAVVFQEAGLFNRTIADNIRMGRPQATAAEVENAARLAEAHAFILNTPQGYDTKLAERAANLSGGERQRLSIARAILKDAPILILDEATSALDFATDALVMRALSRLRQGRTTFVIAHRLSTVRNADQILVMREGEIVERGTFAELLAQRGVFAALVAEGELARERGVADADPEALVVDTPQTELPGAGAI
jgi:ATP-binding cassette subfamily B protein